MSKYEFAERVIESLRDHPGAWRFDDHTAECGGLRIWISNRPYADLTVYSGKRKFGSFFQRREIRRLMDAIRFGRMVEAMECAHQDAERGEVDRVICRMESQ